MPTMTSSPAAPPLLLLFLLVSLCAAAGGHYEPQQQQQQPLNPGDYTAAPVAGGEGSPSSGSTVPAFPVVQAQSNQTCHLDLSNELFGGVAEACGRNLDRGRCCPVLAAWLFAAHARSALQLPPPPPPSDGGDEYSGGGLGSEMPMMPDDSQKCVDSLQSSLQSRNIFLARPNASCDAVLCFCGIRLHQIGSLSCPAAFNLTTPSASPRAPPGFSSSPSPSSLYRNATPTAAVRNLEKSCRNSSYAGCTRCLQALDMLRGGVGGGGAGAGGGDRASRMFGRDCQLMGLTWLLARNRTAYIPTVSAVLRAIMYSSRHLPPPHGGGKQPQYRCSPDQENMPLAVDSLQFEKLEDSAAGDAAVLPAATAAAAVVIFLFLFSHPVASP